jgi:hypothetical protein
MLPVRFSTIQKLMTDSGANVEAVAAFNAIMRLDKGQSKVKDLFYGKASKGSIRWDSAEKLAALWLKVDRNIGQLSYEMAWQPNKTNINGARQRITRRAIKRV